MLLKERYNLSPKSNINFWTLAQSVGRLAFDFGSAYDLTIRDIKPCIGLCADSVEPAWDSPSLSLSPPHSHTLFLRIKKKYSVILTGEAHYYPLFTNGTLRHREAK